MTRRVPALAAVPVLAAAAVAVAGCSPASPAASPDAALALPVAELRPGQVTPVDTHGFHFAAPKGWTVTDETYGPEAVVAVEGPPTATPPGPSVVFLFLAPPVTPEQAVRDVVTGAGARWPHPASAAQAELTVPFLGAMHAATRLSWVTGGIKREEVVVAARAADRTVVAIEESPLAVGAEVAPVLRAVRGSLEVDAPASGPVPSHP